MIGYPAWAVEDGELVARTDTALGTSAGVDEVQQLTFASTTNGTTQFTLTLNGEGVAPAKALPPRVRVRVSGVVAAA